MREQPPKRPVDRARVGAGFVLLQALVAAVGCGPRTERCPTCAENVDAATATDGTTRQDDASITLNPDDRIRIREGSEITLGRGLLRCLSFGVLRSDGSEVALPPHAGTFSVLVDDPAIASAAEPGDCPDGGTGVIGLSSGRSGFAVELRSGDTTFRARSTAVVVPWNIELWPVERGGRLSLGVGVEHRIAVDVRHIHARDLDGNEGLPASGLRIVPRWYTVTSDDDAVASVSRLGDGDFQIRGVSRGQTRVTASYEVPSGSLTAPATAVSVLEGTFQSIRRLALIDDDGARWTPSMLLPGVCLRPALEAEYNDGGDRYLVDLGEEVAWSVDASFARLEPGPRLCIDGDASDEGTLTGCFDGRCYTRSFAAFAPGDVSTLSATLRTTEPVYRRDGLDPAHPAAYYACIPVRLVASFRDGRPDRDVSSSTNVSWHFGPAPSVLLLDAIDFDDDRIVDSDSNPCFEAAAMPGISSIDVQAAYGLVGISVSVAYAETESP